MSPVRLTTPSALTLALAASLLPCLARAQTDSTRSLLPDPGPQAGTQNGATADGEATLRQAGLKTDGPALLEFFRQRTLTDEERRHLQARVPKARRVRQAACPLRVRTRSTHPTPSSTSTLATNWSASSAGASTKRREPSW